MKRILITGGAGFVGSFIARRLRADHAGLTVVVLDNLRRRGSELNVPVLASEGIEFRHGDVRVASDLDDLGGEFDLMIEASAEPSVLAGLPGAAASPRYVLDSNLGGAINCFEFARKCVEKTIFLSTSRVYSIEPLRGLALEEGATRFEILPTSGTPGISAEGISEAFPTHLARSFYGTSKLAAEQVLQEYVSAYGMKAIINRCGVIAGPGQFGKTDQGVFTHWVASHYFKQPLTYMGFGGSGKQVRDLLHPEDLYQLVANQVRVMGKHSGGIYNVGGGRAGSVSLREMTDICRDATGRTTAIAHQLKSASVDIPYYVSDSSRACETFGWKPARDVRAIVGDIVSWLEREEGRLKPVLGAA